MNSSELAPDPNGASRRNLLHQELRETLERARLGGFFYPMATGLAFLVTSLEYIVPALAITGSFTLIAFVRLMLHVSPNPDGREIRQKLQQIWSLILLTAIAWGAFSTWSFLNLPEPAPLVAVLFSGAFGMALAHSMCMRRLPCTIAIASVMLPGTVLLWRFVAPGVALMWVVYMTYMMLVLLRSYREYRTRLELEEDLRQQRDLFEKQSLIDSLTGLGNRRAFTDALARLLAKSRTGSPVSLLILDIDHFKRINDSFGHSAGDACLVSMAQRLQAHFDKPGDLIVRLGGEEFGVILECDGHAAFERAEGFRKDLESRALEFGAEQARVTVSIGSGSFDPLHHSGADALYLEVDTALYRGKVSGRNRTEQALKTMGPQPAGIAPAS